MSSTTDRLGAVGDALRVQQVVTNLLNNAVKFTAEGTVHLSATLFRTQAGPHLKIQVCDTGIGIDLAEADWLFQTFQQADASTARRFGGTGLGLAITDQLVRLMGGVLEVHSKPGEGTTFTAHWPLILSEAQAPALNSREADGPRKERLPTRLLCELDLADGPAAEEEAKALACHLQHLGATSVRRQERLQRAITATVMPVPVVLADENCLMQDRPEWLAQKVTLLILSREPGSFSLPAHLAGLNWKLIGKPVGRSALAHALSLDTAGDPEPVSSNLDAAGLAHAGVRAAGALQGLHVLVAEDHTVNQILIKHTLQAAGCRVHLVPNGLLAIDALYGPESATTGPFDLVLMDCQMPQLDGLSATERIRKRESASQSPRLPIIAMTALAMPEDRQRCLDSGMDDYCSKPIDENILVTKVAKWARSFSEAGPAGVAPTYADLAQGAPHFYQPSSDAP